MSNGSADQFIGEIRPFAGKNVPAGWNLCDGKALYTHEHDILFALIGYTFGGADSLFKLPDLRSRIAVGTGQQPGGHDYARGEMGGGEKVALEADQVGSHIHPVHASTEPAASFRPSGRMLAAPPGGLFYVDGAVGPADATLAAATIQPTLPGSAAHNNVMPGLVVNYIIALQGKDPRSPNGEG
jgi:microcystin-dependent protein